jgi:NAD-dependent oxidoreductase involved in siderophore biosynthesis
VSIRRRNLYKKGCNIVQAESQKIVTKQRQQTEHSTVWRGIQSNFGEPKHGQVVKMTQHKQENKSLINKEKIPVGGSSPGSQNPS